jgi:hypothetical protein
LEIKAKVLALVSDAQGAAEPIDRRAGLGEDEGENMTILITLGVVCLVLGVVLRAFSKPPSDLSLNQRTK